MKPSIAFIATILLFLFTTSTEAQVKNVQTEAEKQGTNRLNHKIDKGIDSGFDKLEEGIGSLFGKKKKKKKGQAEQVNTSSESNSQEPTENTPAIDAPQAQAMKVQWAKFDFVPGDEVIFEDAPSIDEENGEFPSRWDLIEGQVEIASVNGENVIMFLEGGEIIPYLKNPKEDYLPEVFTIEFDVWFNKGQSTSNRYFIHFRDQKNQWQKGLSERLTITPTGLEFGQTDKRYPGTENLNWSHEPIGKWRHISIAYTKGKFKAYMDDTRLINVPHLDGNPWGLTIEALAENVYLRNIRIAKGGVKYYDRVLSDGKIIVNGIRFDVNQATIKPESNGAINKIFQLMQKQPDLNFSVEGHTDSDGDKFVNESLSKKRAKAVMDRLVSMGISSSRLKSKGWGESKPIDSNATAEGKANNRRVEFVKFTGSAAASKSGSRNSAFDKIDRKTIAVKLEEESELMYVPISNQTGMVNGVGSIIVYATTGGKLGKLEILDVDKNNNYELTIRYVTFNYNGSVYSKSNKMKIEGTAGCDLDEGCSGAIDRSDTEFRLSRQDKVTTSLHPTDESILRIFK